MRNEDLNNRSKYSNDRPMVDEGRPVSKSNLGIMLVAAFAIVAGLLLWSLADNNRVASTTSTGLTSGSSSTTPSPSNPPPAKGASESSSTR
jgi:hypothetical protein